MTSAPVDLAVSRIFPNQPATQTALTSSLEHHVSTGRFSCAATRFAYGRHDLDFRFRIGLSARGWYTVLHRLGFQTQVATELAGTVIAAACPAHTI